MRSSGSTLSLPDRRPIRRYVVRVGDDHPRACTGRRLLRSGWAIEPPRRGGRAGVGPIVLDPFAARPLSGVDRPAAEEGGLLAVDCSWNRLSADGHLAPGSLGSVRRGPGRRLPLLIATNPQHYGRVGELNTAEALGAALAILGHENEGRALLFGFAGGHSFFAANRERLRCYAEAADPDAVLRAERDLFGAAPAAPRSVPEDRPRDPRD